MRKLGSLGAFYQRIRTSGAHKPLRTFGELCEEMGVSKGVMTAKLCLADAPKPEFRNIGKYSTSNRWYEPVAFRKWWKSIKECEA